MKIIGVKTRDVRFPTSLSLDGSDAMNPDPDYSASYLIIEVEDESLKGHAFVFTIGRGNDIQTYALQVVAESLVGQDLMSLLNDMGETSRRLIHDSQLRWLGPEKGVSHMAIGAVVNALWDIKAKLSGVPLWKLLANMESDALVDLVDFRYISDALSENEALSILKNLEDTKQDRIQTLEQEGYPAYTTSPGWLGYDDQKLARLCEEALQDGYTTIKLKVGASLEDDIRRCTIAREVIGKDIRLAVDANQRWGVQESIEWIGALEKFDLAWIEEPTNPDDVLAYAAIAKALPAARLATGEHTANRVMAKQLLQTEALSILQIDATRVAGVNENIAILLMSAKYGVPVYSHAGGVGLCEAVQHISMFDYLAVSGNKDEQVIEYVDHLHEHFVDPVVIQDGKYRAPQLPGASFEMFPASLDEYDFANGKYWSNKK